MLTDQFGQVWSILAYRVPYRVPYRVLPLLRAFWSIFINFGSFWPIGSPIGSPIQSALPLCAFWSALAYFGSSGCLSGPLSGPSSPSVCFGPCWSILVPRHLLQSGLVIISPVLVSNPTLSRGNDLINLRTQNEAKVGIILDHFGAQGSCGGFLV